MIAEMSRFRRVRGGNRILQQMQETLQGEYRVILQQVLDLFYRQDISKNQPKPQMTAYFKSIVEDGQIVTIEREGKIIAFSDYWIVNRKIRDMLLRMERWQTVSFAKRGMYPHCKTGKHLYANFIVVDKDFRNQFLPFELMKKINEKNPQMLSVVYHRLDGAAKLIKRREK